MKRDWQSIILYIGIFSFGLSCLVLMDSAYHKPEYDQYYSHYSDYYDQGLAYRQEIIKIMADSESSERKPVKEEGWIDPLSKTEEELKKEWGLPEVGENVGDWKVKSVEIIKQSGYRIDFTGTTTVSGRYNQGEIGFIDMCFIVNDEDIDKIPRFKTDERIPWFCIPPEDIPKGTFDGQKATIMIANYNLFYYPSEVSDYANLIKEID